MKNANEDFANLLKIISTNYNKQLSTDQTDLFKFMAKQHGFNKFYNAMLAHMSEPEDGMFFPTIAHISKHINGTAKQNSKDIEFKAQGQWEMSVMRAVTKCGSYRTPDFKDPITSACIVAAGGWPAICKDNASCTS